MLRKISIFVIIVLAIFLLLFIPEAKACTPLEPDFWYVGVVEVLDSDLPAGISVNSEIYQNRFYPNGLPGFTVSNDSDQSIRLLYGRDQRELAKQGYYQNGINVADELVENGIVMRPGRSERLVIVNSDSDNLFQQLQLFSDPGFKDLNISADDRVGDVPDPQQLNLGLYVDSKLYIVPVTVSYEYNPKYDPHRYRDSAEECGEFNATQEAIIASVADVEPSNNVDSILTSQDIESKVTSEISGESNRNPRNAIFAVSGLLIGLLLIIIWTVQKTVRQIANESYQTTKVCQSKANSAEKGKWSTAWRMADWRAER